MNIIEYYWILIESDWILFNHWKLKYFSLHFLSWETLDLCVLVSYTLNCNWSYLLTLSKSWMPGAVGFMWIQIDSTGIKQPTGSIQCRNATYRYNSNIQSCGKWNCWVRHVVCYHLDSFWEHTLIQDEKIENMEKNSGTIWQPFDMNNSFCILGTFRLQVSKCLTHCEK